MRATHSRPTANPVTAELASVDRCSRPETPTAGNGRHQVACQRGAMFPFHIDCEHRPTRTSRAVADGDGDETPVWL
jgi:hypothetical protein